MDEQIKQIKAYALSNDDIQNILEPDTKIFTYPDFGNMTTIDEAFDKLGRCIFLFLTTSPTSGHWLTMFRKGNTVEYFDSYGEKPEAQREWLSQDELEALGEDTPYLMDLLKKSPYKVYWNTHAYQKDKNDINTCGRWAVARLITKDLSNQQFYNLVRDQMKEKGLTNPDDWVALFTYEMLGK
jgi:hypothetical protein